MGSSFEPAIPILRIFSVEKAREFYLDYLGFTVDWEHRFEPGTPLYMQVRRGDLVLHLSEHHGDGAPGIGVFVHMRGLEDFHREISARQYAYLRPGIMPAGWNEKARTMTVTDPFFNRITFAEGAK